MRRASGVWRQLRLPILAVLAVVVLAVPGEAVGASSNLVVSQVYGGGGNAGATLKNDFIEVFNRGGSAVDLAGWSVQYASATGTGWTVTALSGSVQPGSHYLIQEAAGAGGSVELPTPDAAGSISMSATAAKVALANTTTPLAGSCPSGAQIVDLVGYGTTASCFEGSGAAPAPSNTTADL
ncbi:MAG: lamin tail domain-containing protein, partial [Actinobacteria bacterium]